LRVANSDAALERLLLALGSLAEAAPRTASSRQGAPSNRAAARRKTWLMTQSVELNNIRSARSASLSESEWDWERRSAFFWLVMAVVAGEVNE
jgi:hypothetical protein